MCVVVLMTELRAFTLPHILILLYAMITTKLGIVEKDQGIETKMPNKVPSAFFRVSSRLLIKKDVVMKMIKVLAVLFSVNAFSAMAIELNVDTAKQAAELAGVKVPDALGGSSNTSTMGVAASALGGGSNLGTAAALAGGGNSGNGALMGAAAGALGVKKEPTPEEKAADALKGMLK